MEFWNDTTPRAKISTKSAKILNDCTNILSKQSDKKEYISEPTLKTDLRSAIDGTYLPTPRAHGQGGAPIWKSAQLPPKKILLDRVLRNYGRNLLTIINIIYVIDSMHIFELNFRRNV